jgi:hypothetical protein
MKKKKKKEKESSIKLKHQIVFKNLLENISKKAVGRGHRNGMKKAMMDAGYSETYSGQPCKITKSKSWNALVKEYFPADTVLKKHEELLNAKKVKAIQFPLKTPDAEAEEICRLAGFTPIKLAVFLGQKWVYCFIPNGDLQDKALDKLYKITNRYKETIAIDDKDKYRQMSDAELAEAIQKEIRFFKKK